MKIVNAVLITVLLLFAGMAQAITCPAGNFCVQKLTAASTDCSTAGSCVIFPIPQDTGTLGVSLTGTFTATVVFEGTADNNATNDNTWTTVNCTPPGSTTAVTSATAAGSWRCSVGGLTHFRVRASAYTSGPTVTINSSRASLSGGGGGGITALTGDVNASGTGSVAASVVQVNGAAIPLSANTLGSNAIGQLIASIPNIFLTFTLDTGCLGIQAGDLVAFSNDGADVAGDNGIEPLGVAAETVGAFPGTIKVQISGIVQATSVPGAPGSFAVAPGFYVVAATGADSGKASRWINSGPLYSSSTPPYIFGLALAYQDVSHHFPILLQQHHFERNLFLINAVEGLNQFHIEFINSSTVNANQDINGKLFFSTADQRIRVPYTVTAADELQGFAVVPIVWTTAFPDNNNTVTWSLEDPTAVPGLNFVTLDMHSKTGAGFDAAFLVTAGTAGRNVIVHAHGSED